MRRATEVRTLWWVVRRSIRMMTRLAMATMFALGCAAPPAAAALPDARPVVVTVAPDVAVRLDDHTHVVRAADPVRPGDPAPVDATPDRDRIVPAPVRPPRDLFPGTVGWRAPPRR